MSETQDRKFAYGSNTHDDCPCPAVVAGYKPGEEKVPTLIAGQYDVEIKQQTPSDQGIVDEQVAKEAWYTAIEYYEQKAEQERYKSDIRNHEKVAKVGREIARELGW